MLRASSYNIHVELPNLPDEVLLVHGYSGAYDKVSRFVATYLAALDPGRPARPVAGLPAPAAPRVPSDRTIETLRKRGYLTELSVDEEQRLFARLAHKLHALGKARRPTYVFMPTYDCNLRCTYCFQAPLRAGGERSGLLRVMSPELVDRIFAAMPRIEADHGAPAGEQVVRNIGLFGGEPFLPRSLATVERICENAVSQGKANLWAVTNGTELHRFSHLLGGDGVNWLQITLDGPPAEHDRRRVHADGQGSFEQITRNVSMALERGVCVDLRVNVDRSNIAHLPAFAREIVARQWHLRQNLRVYAARAVDNDQKQQAPEIYTSRQLDQALAELRRQHPEIAFIERPLDGLEKRAQGIFAKRDDPLPGFRPSFCGAHNGMYVFDALGDVYACWERNGDPRLRIGRIAESEGLVLDETNHAKWRNRDVTSNPTCSRCRYALYCGGGCCVAAEASRGGFFANCCDGFSARFRESVAAGFTAHAAGQVTVPHAGPGCDGLNISLTTGA
ncbi:MAG: radical SAM protein [Candidatus Schekmanbacteria bacterium]|nr:radical SAM protein [Candidatus Schekmanbacteria bacterium]